MSINSIQLKTSYSEHLHNSSYIPFDLYDDGSESVVFRTASERQSLSLLQHKSSDNRLNINAANGHIYLTNKRIAFITSSQGDINCFLFVLEEAAIMQLSHRLVSPWFGANYFEFTFFTGNKYNSFPNNCWISGKIHFNDGGLFDFIQKFDGLLHDIINNKHIDEELPRYSAQ